MNRNNKIRCIIALISTFISVVPAIIFFALCLKEGGNIFETLLGASMLGFTFGGMIVGFCHISAVHQKIKKLLLIGIPYRGSRIFTLTDMSGYLKTGKVVQL